MLRIQALFVTAENPFLMFVSVEALAARGSFVGGQKERKNPGSVVLAKSPERST